MVNWGPAAQTALSDEEVIYRESQGSCTTCATKSKERRVTSS